MNADHKEAQRLSEKAESLIREACQLWEDAAVFEEKAAQALHDQPRGRRILTISFKAMRHKAKILGKLFGRKS